MHLKVGGSARRRPRRTASRHSLCALAKVPYDQNAMQPDTHRPPATRRRVVLFRTETPRPLPHRRRARCFPAFILTCYWIVFAAVAGGGADPAPGSGRIPASISIDAADTVNTFRPADMFGLNAVPYVDRAEFTDTNVLTRLQALGTVFVRYPSGIADDVHWNGAGSFNSNGWWLPDAARYQPSFQGKAIHRGTTSHYGRPSMVTDGDTNTFWLSNADAAAPNGQWLYVDLGSVQQADALSILWGRPFATRFTIQYWKPTSINQWAPYSHTADDWIATTASNRVGTGGLQRVGFEPVRSRYFRIFMTASSSSPAQYAIAELEVLSGTNRLVTHANNLRQDPADGNWKPVQTWTVASTTDPACARDQVYSFDFESFMAWLKTLSPRAIPLITINCGGATPQEAAAWVHYANRVKGYGIRYWEIGNEMNGAWETGGPLGAREYTRQFLAFYQAMKAEDPTILIAGPGVSDAAVASNDYDGRSYVQAFMDHLADVGKAACAEIIDVHWYPFFMNNDRQTTWDTVGQLSRLPANLDQWLGRHPARTTVPIMITEYNSGAGTPFSTSIENALWLANTLGEFIRGLGSRGFASYWTILHPADAHANRGGGDQSLLQLESNAWHHQERSTYWAMLMLSSCWAIPGDASVHRLVRTSANQPLLSVYADRRPDGILSLLVVNRDAVAAYDTALQFTNFHPNAEAKRWTFSPSNFAWSTNSLPYHADPGQPPTLATQTGVGSSFRHTFPASSLTVFQFTPRP
jgi:hypothetical protein